MAEGGKQVLVHRVEQLAAAAGADGPTTAAGHGAEPSAGPGDPTDTEQQLGFLEAVRLYPRAIAWSAFFSLGVISTAFDQQLVGSLYAAPQFRRDFGYQHGGEYIIDASWQSALSMGSPVGQVVGALLAAYPMQRFGRKRTFAGCVLSTAGLVLVQFFEIAMGVLVVGELLAGLVLGVFVVIAPTYGSEVCPTAIRGHLASYIELCFVLGQLVANGVTAGTQHMHTHWAYSLPFALQWLWAAVIVPGRCTMVTSYPLSKKSWAIARELGRVADAVTLECLGALDRVNLRRTEIASGVYCCQVLSGIYLVSYGTYFFQQAGLPTEQAFNMSVGFLGVGLVGVVVSWFLLVGVGRRLLFVGGLAILSGLQFLIGILDCVPGRPSGAIWAESALMLVWNLLYNTTIGPVCFVLLSECSATRVRSKTIAVATAAQGLLGIVMTVAIPYMINPAQANMQGKLGFFFGGLAGLCLLWAYFRVPETRGRTYGELDLLFDKGVSARKFESCRLAVIPEVGATVHTCR
ncbi:maltose permease [Ophiocordyceps sinensis CO18]|uniref:Maltose permease n=1 Tax=Ophiocordyceps sinensis (strain Co18 / CGMCC 3.14243) TaxID=911162 RepID=T5AHP3_OPHSC|nr:maltose permease [Ophiocordyceps sinensis CO18]